jgi:hypothetical protein
MAALMMLGMNDQEKAVKKIPEKDWDLLRFIDSLKVLTVIQLSALSRRSPQVIRRRLRALGEQGFISTQQQAYGNRRGRPEDLVLLSEAGCRALHKQTGRNGKFQKNDTYAAPEFVEHELLVNWFFIHLIQIEKQIPQLSVHYFTQHFSTAEDAPSTEHITRIQLPEDDDKLEFIPDGIFTISDSVSNKTLLFFLEVDMGTETLASPARGFKDVRQKIVNYQDLFRSGRYKRYERFFNARLNGFRVLFVTHSPSRLKTLCQLTASMPPADFIWLSDRDQLFSSGLSDEIWVRGGALDLQPYTILGKIRVSRKAHNQFPLGPPAHGSGK